MASMWMGSLRSLGRVESYPAIWDAACEDTFAPSYFPRAVREAGAVEQHTEERKLRTYNCLESYYFFTPVAIKTSGVLAL
jgi:hypothetical protein